MLASLFSGAVAAAAVTAGYQSMAPEGQWYGSTFTRLARGSKQLALTYDHGPNDPHTLRLLAVLDKHNMQASLFRIGRQVRRPPDIAPDLPAAGHTAGNHTPPPALPTLKAQAETRPQPPDCRAALSAATGALPNLSRPPFGGRRPAVLRIAR